MVLYSNLMLPLTIRTSVSRLQPFFNVLLVYYMFQEKTTGSEIVAMIVCSACVLYLLFSEPEEYNEDEYAAPRFGSYKLGMIIMLLSLPMRSYGVCALRGAQDVDPAIIGMMPRIF